MDSQSSLDPPKQKNSWAPQLWQKSWAPCTHCGKGKKLGIRQLAVFCLPYWSATEECSHWACFFKGDGGQVELCGQTTAWLASPVASWRRAGLIAILVPLGGRAPANQMQNKWEMAWLSNNEHKRLAGGFFPLLFSCTSFLCIFRSPGFWKGGVSR